MNIQAKDVNNLRQRTGAGMMDCKNALIQAEGNFDTAVDILRKRGQKISSKRADKEATEGSVFAGTNSDDNFGVLITLGCETDFVAKNETFKDFGNKLLEIAISNDVSTKEELLSSKEGDNTIEQLITDMIGKIGEKIEVTDLQRVTASFVIPYIHLGSNLGVLVGLSDNSNTDKYLEAGKDVAMQIAAMNPLALNREKIDSTTVQKELEIAKEQARNENKPEPVIEKIAQGKLQKFYKDNTLLEQPFIKDSNMSVDGYLKSINPNLTVIDFKRVSIK